jgi:molybdate transport system substrate-binding protein
MKRSLLACAAVVGAACLQGLAAEAAEIKILSAAGIKTVVDELAPQFERATGHKLITKFVGGPAVQQAIASGEVFEVAISQPTEIDKLLKDGKIILDSRADVARSGMGMGMRKGSAKPDIGTADGLKRTLLDAKSIAYAGQGASGTFFTGLFERLGIAADMKPKLKSMPAGAASAEAVARGDAEVVLLSIPNILAVEGVDFVGPLPPDLQYYSGFAAGVVAGAPQAEAGRAFIKFLTSEAALPVLKAKGLEASAP